MRNRSGAMCRASRLSPRSGRLRSRMSFQRLNRSCTTTLSSACSRSSKTRLGLALLPSGRKRRTLEAAFARLLEEDLENRVVDFDVAAASAAAALAAERQVAGRSVDMRDTLIAGVVLARRATLATRNVRHFVDLTVPVVDPWKD